jgi:hypothetical protein
MVVEVTLARNHHPEMGHRSCLGLIRCADRYGAKRMDLACAKALTVAGPMGPKRTFIDATLKEGLEQSEQDDTEPPTRLPRHHEHLRGAQYFSQQDLHHEH